MILTRELYPWEIPATVPLARRFHDTANLGPGFSESRYLGTLGQHLDNGTLAAFGALQDGELVGVLIGIMGPCFLAEIHLAQELLWWMDEGHRSGTASLRLLRLFEAWAKTNGANGVVMATFASTDSRVEAFYRRRGYQALETHHLILWPSPLPHSLPLPQ